jgi:diguanylate cyclase (GGDEF)-like protein
MSRQPPLRLDELPDSPYAAARRTRSLRIGFVTPLEREFQEFHLERAIGHVRVWLVLLLGLAALRTATGFFDPAFEWTGATLVRCLIVLPALALMSWAAWSRQYLRRYRQIARLAMPVATFFSTLLIGALNTSASDPAVAFLMVNILAGYLLIGALFVEGVVLAVVVMAAFATGALYSGMAADQMSSGLGLLFTTSVVGAIVSFNMESSNRDLFLERGLLSEMATRDGLTGLRNRRTFDEHLERLWAQAMRDGERVALLLIDIDHFKAYNDVHGHLAGDDCLRRVSTCVQTFARRPLDLAARYGGEELAIFLYQASEERTREIAELARREVAQLQITHALSPTEPFVTVSIGAACVEPLPGRSAEGLVQLADEALYDAKQEGRNRVVLRSSEYASMTTGSFRRQRVAG